MSRESFINRDKRHGSPSHRRAREQEKETAKRYQGSTIPGSGCGYQKGDVRVKGVVRIEAKTTKNKSFSVTREMVSKIEEASLPNGEMPAIVVEFLDSTGKPECEVAIVPTYILDALKSSN